MQTKIGGVSLAGKILVFQDIEFQLISLNKAMDSMIASAKKSEGEYDRYFGASDRSTWDG